MIELVDGLFFEVESSHLTPILPTCFHFEAHGHIEKDGRQYAAVLLCAASAYNLKIESPKGETPCESSSCCLPK